MATDELNEQNTNTNTNNATNQEQNTPPVEASAVEVSKKSKRSPSLIPGSDIGKATVSNSVAVAWEANPQITLMWKTVEEFKIDVSNFARALESKTSVKTKRSPLSFKIKTVNKAIDRLLIFVKDELKVLFGKEAFQSYFPEFGIQYIKGGYKIPYDMQERQPALAMLIAAVQKYELRGANSNLATWQALKDEYDQYTSESTLSTTTESKHIGDKVIYRPKVVKTLECLAGVIKCNYPDNYENVLRSWGFLRETY